MQKLPMTFESNDNGWRTKLYQLDEGNAWIDKGTGKVSFLGHAGQDKSPVMVVLSETDQSTLLSTNLKNEDIYVRQNGNLSYFIWVYTLYVWTLCLF